MTQFWYMLKEEDRETLKRIYKNITGKDYVPPEKKIEIESLQEIDKLMREKANPTKRK